MAILSRFQRGRVNTTNMANANGNHHNRVVADTPVVDGPEAEKQLSRDEPIRIFRLRIILMGILVSMGGLIFGYDTGKMHNSLS